MMFGLRAAPRIKNGAAEEASSARREIEIGISVLIVPQIHGCTRRVIEPSYRKEATMAWRFVAPDDSPAGLCLAPYELFPIRVGLLLGSR